MPVMAYGAVAVMSEPLYRCCSPRSASTTSPLPMGNDTVPPALALAMPPPPATLPVEESLTVTVVPSVRPVMATYGG